jgi:hypothetical protein
MLHLYGRFVPSLQTEREEVSAKSLKDAEERGRAQHSRDEVNSHFTLGSFDSAISLAWRHRESFTEKLQFQYHISTMNTKREKTEERSRSKEMNEP